MSQIVRILVVDDNFINRQYFSFALTKKGYIVELAENGFEAIDKANESEFDIILTDIKMPDLDGYETTKRIKQISHHENTPVVATSAEEISEDSKNLFVDTLLKPIKLQQVYNVVNRFCQVNETELDFNQKLAMEFAYNDRKIMLKMIAMFRIELPKQMLLLGNLLEDQNYNETSYLIHNIRGSCKVSGAEKLDKKLEKLSILIKHNDFKNIYTCFDLIKTAVESYLKIKHVI